MKKAAILVVGCGLLVPKLAGAALQYGCFIAMPEENAGPRCEINSTAPTVDDDTWSHIGVDAEALVYPTGSGYPGDPNIIALTAATAFVYAGGACQQWGYYTAYGVEFYRRPISTGVDTVFAGHSVWGPSQLVTGCG